MRATKGGSLAEYLKAHPRKRGPRCWCCGLPERAEMDAAARAGGEVSGIRRWLIEERGYSSAEATPAKFQHHFYAGRHHEQA